MPGDPFDFFELESLKEMRAKREQAVRDGEAIAAAEAVEAAAAKARVDALTLRANESFLLAEYQSAGIAPPFTNGRGVPTVSLALLVRQGWRIEQLGDNEMALVRP